MGRMTVSIPDELLERFRKQNPDINVAEVVRRGIIKRLEELEKFEKLKAKGMIDRDLEAVLPGYDQKTKLVNLPIIDF